MPEARPDGVRVFAPAKINLFLHVGANRADGYHSLQSLVVFADAGDELRASPGKTLSLTADGPFAPALPKASDNLVLRAAEALATRTHVQPAARILLTKNLPVAAGMGGGSADAAAALRALRDVWHCQISDGELMAVAIGLGSDVPACVLSAPCWMEGRGERITPLANLPPASLVLVNPGVAVATVEVFSRITSRTGVSAMTPPFARTARDLVAYLATGGNDLEAPACEMEPVIDETLSALQAKGALLARMSGSGGTCFGLFENNKTAATAAAAIAKTQKTWWVKAARIAPADIGLPRPLAQ